MASKTWTLTFAALAASVMGVACGEEAAVPRPAERVLGPLPGALLSVAGEADGALWIAGADARDGRGAYLGRLAAGADEVERVDLRAVDPAGGALWWVHVVAPGHALAAGDGGRVFEIVDGVVTRIDTGSDVQLYGVAAQASGVALAVGGAPATVLRIDPARAPGEAQALPPHLPRDARLFKALALADGTFEVIGERGVHMIVTAGEAGLPARVVSAPVPGAPRLVTVHGDGSPGATRVAVGGAVEGYAVEIRDDLTFRRISPEGSPLLNGVFVGPRTFVVGFLGAVFERVGDGWRRVDGVDWEFDAHAVWVDARGVAWVAGGRLLDGSLTEGALWRVGPEPAPALAARDLTVDASDASPEEVAADVAPEVDAPRCPALAPALALELGERDSRGCFTAFVDGGQARVVNGPQGGSHVELAVRFPTDGAAAEPVGRIGLEATLVVGGTSVARFETRELPAEPDVDSSATLVTTDVPLIFAGADPSPWLGRSARLTCGIEAAGRTFEATVEVTLAR
ncbi:MAG: hypothetical protein IT385_13570 [Deltaproteobacteria bacterium]|nr:hypothetical protein [Deltaproteobacteria bacterium]